MKTYIPLNGLSGVAIAVLPSIICIQLTFSDGLGRGAQKQKHKKQPFSDASASHLSLVLWHV